jgi:hypothetical protein
LRCDLDEFILIAKGSMSGEYKVHLRPFREGSSHALDVIGFVLVVGIEEANDIARGMFEAGHKCGQLTPVALANDFQARMAGGALFENTGSFIGGSIVYDNDLRRRHGLREGAFDRICDK